MLASATPVMRLVAPGPSVDMHTPGAAGEPAVDVGHERRALLVVRGDELMGLSSSASITSMFSSPGMPKMNSTPSFSRHFTNSSAAFMGVRSPWW